MNTGGITLTSFELVTAMFAKDGFHLRDDIGIKLRRKIFLMEFLKFRIQKKKF